MTPKEVYYEAKDGDIIVNKNWENSAYQYVKLGGVVFDPEYNEVSMIGHKQREGWEIKASLTCWAKSKMRGAVIIKFKERVRP